MAKRNDFKASDALIEKIVDLLAHRHHKHQIFKVMDAPGDGWQPVRSRRAQERYLRLARERLMKRMGTDVDEQRAFGLAYWQSVLANRIPGEHVSVAMRCFAQKRIERLLGLEAPRQLQVTAAVKALDAEAWESV